MVGHDSGHLDVGDGATVIVGNSNLDVVIFVFLAVVVLDAVIFFMNAVQAVSR